MSVFFFAMISIYGAMHGYLVWKVHGAWPNLGHWRFAVYAFCILMVAMPFVARNLGRAGESSLASVLTLVGWFWLIIIYWFFCAGILAEGWNLAVHAVALAQPGAKGFLLRPGPQLAVTAALVAFGFVWGFIEISSIRLRTVTLETNRLPAGTRPIRILQISDTHLSRTLSKHHLQKILAIIERTAPDIIVGTGDLVDSPVNQLRETAPLLAAVNPRLGKLACLGNHDFYHGLADCIAWHEAAGFRLLRGESALAGKYLRIVGIDDPAGVHRSAETFLDEDQALGRRPDNRFVILLKHRPTVRENSLGNFDLQLSGHTHGGQVFPFMFVVRIMNGICCGLKELPAGSKLYVTRGAGAWGPPIRVLAPPEVALFILHPQNEE